MIASAVQVDTGYLQVAAFGSKEQPGLERALELKPGLIESLQRQEQVDGVSIRILSGALLNFKDSSRFVSVLAADFGKERQITVLHKKIVTGRFPRPVDGKVEAVLGDRLARALGMGIGDRFYLVSGQFDGSVGALVAELVGIVRTKQTHIDSSRVYISDAAGQELYGTNLPQSNRRFATSIALGVPNFRAAQDVAQLLRQEFPVPKPEAGVRPEESKIFSPVVLNWQDLNPGMMDLVKLSNRKMSIFTVFLVISISFGILNAVQMSIQERLREFGVLLALGVKPRGLLRLILLEVALVVIPAILIGIALASLLALYLEANPIELSGTSMGRVYENMGLPPRWKPMVSLAEQWQVAVEMIVPALVVAALAARRLARLNPIQSINVK